MIRMELQSPGWTPARETSNSGLNQKTVEASRGSTRALGTWEKKKE